MEQRHDDHYLSDLPLWADEDARNVLERLSTEYRVEVDVITDLVSLQRDRQHQERAHGINERIREILGRVEDQ